MMAELLRDLRHTDDFYITVQGDLGTVGDVDNVKQALLQRLITKKGTLVHRPDYGVGIQDFLGAPLNFDTKRKMAVAIQAQFARDPRVARVIGIKIDEIPGNTFSVVLVANVEIDGVGTAEFEFDIGE